MSSRQSRSIFRTFCFKLALLYALLTAATLALAFVVSFSALRSLLQTDFDTGLSRIADRVERTCSDFSKAGGFHDADQLPSSVSAIINGTFPGFKRLHGRRRDSRFIVTGFYHGILYRIECRQDGTVTRVASEAVSDIFRKAATDVGETSLVGGIVFSRNGSVWASSDLTPFGLTRETAKAAFSASAEEYGTIVNDSANLRYFKRDSADQSIALAVLAPNAAPRYALGKLRVVFVYLFAFLLPTAFVIGWVVSSRSMRGVLAVADTANRIAEGHLSQRVPTTNRSVEIERLASSFNGMLDQIETLISEMKEVSVNVAHDSKTPITRIRGALETVDWSDAPSEQRDAVGRVLEECDKLTDLINNLMEIAKAEAGAMPLSNDVIDLCEEARNAADLFESLAEMVGANLSVHCPEAPVTISGDKARLRRVISNLLDNALKFGGDENTVRITVSSRDENALLTVADAGPGIPVEKISRVFDRFYRCDQSRSTQGNGLGLAFCKAVIERHGGTIKVESGQGATFTIALPVKR